MCSRTNQDATATQRFPSTLLHAFGNLFAEVFSFSVLPHGNGIGTKFYI
jgi:hypothetical protein